MGNAGGVGTAAEAAVLAPLTNLIEELTVDWDTGLAGRIGLETRLVADLGFASIDVVALFTAVDEHWGRRDWPYEELLNVDGRYVDDLMVRDIVDFLVQYGAR